MFPSPLWFILDGQKPFLSRFCDGLFYFISFIDPSATKGVGKTHKCEDERSGGKGCVGMGKTTLMVDPVPLVPIILVTPSLTGASRHLEKHFTPLVSESSCGNALSPD